MGRPVTCWRFLFWKAAGWTPGSNAPCGSLNKMPPTCLRKPRDLEKMVVKKIQIAA